MPQSAHPFIAARHDQMFPTLDRSEIERLRRFGEARSYPAGERVVRAGEVSPGLIVVLSGKIEVIQGSGLGRRTMPEMAEYSAVAAVHTIWLAARAEGLGMGWVSILDPAVVAAALDVPDTWRFIGYFCLGYPSTEDAVPALERAGWEARHPPESFILRR